ncbi:MULTISPECIES: ATP-binding protein [unclassified Streptomyces]|uniref:ATP-binding protein n=1 Tax=unclassified Streptomyces TaxID=2593676 RepID=UPI002E2C2448|nr:ATP-binding protein [Streptomyces sp. NBC_00223]
MPHRLRRGPLYRLTLTATASDPHRRVACVGPARRLVHCAATGWGLDGAALDDLVTVASVLLANAARYAGPARLTALLRLDAAGARVRFEVEDQGAALPRIVAGIGDDQAVTGRGLLMVEALAEERGSTRPAPARSSGPSSRPARSAGPARHRRPGPTAPPAATACGPRLWVPAPAGSRPCPWPAMLVGPAERLHQGAWLRLLRTARHEHPHGTGAAR